MKFQQLLLEIHVTISTCTRMQLQPQIAANIHKHTSDKNTPGENMNVNTHSETLMDASDSGSPDLCTREPASVKVCMSVWAWRLCQQVRFFCSYLLFLLTESICRRTGNDVQSVYILSNSSPEPICLPAACHSFLLPFLHTFAFTSLREAAVAVYVFCLFPCPRGLCHSC